METKELPVNDELQNRVLDKMFVFEAFGKGIVKCSIPDDVFKGERKVKVDDKEYGIYDIPEMSGQNGSSKIIQRAIEKFIAGYGDPTWSQIVTDVVEEESFRQLVSYPKAVYLKK